MKVAAKPRVDQRRGRRTCRTCAGFTLVELMVVLAITGLVLSMALPSFQSHLQKARRAEVMVSIMQVQLSQSRWRSNAPSYASLADIGVSSVPTGGHYTLQLNSDTPDRYEVMATATGSQTRDSICRYLKLSVIDADVQRSSGPDASVANGTDTNRRCWNQ